MKRLVFLSKRSAVAFTLNFGKALCPSHRRQTGSVDRRERIIFRSWGKDPVGGMANA